MAEQREKEEKERRRRDLEEFKKRNEEAKGDGGVRYKGRGVMKAPGVVGGYESGGMRGW